MNNPPTHVPFTSGLSRTSSGLSPAHRELIKMLAAKPVEDFLAESESDHTIEDAPADAHEADRRMAEETPPPFTVTT